MSAAEAATVILDAVRTGQWRVLIGEDAHWLDETVRADPHKVYGPDGISPFGFRPTASRAAEAARGQAG